MVSFFKHLSPKKTLDNYLILDTFFPSILKKKRKEISVILFRKIAPNIIVVSFCAYSEHGAAVFSSRDTRMRIILR